MYYVYILKSTKSPQEHYVGYSENLKSRLKAHDWGDPVHTRKFKPWKLVCYLGFDNKEAAKQFEHYLKTGSGRAFLQRHLLN